MRFSVTMPDDLVARIDQIAEEIDISRADWIRQACTDALTTPSPEEHRANQIEVIELRARATYQEQTITNLEADRGYYRGEVARLQQEIVRLAQENTSLVQRCLPAPGGPLARVRRWLSGNP